MNQWLSEMLERSSYFMPHGHCYLWIPSLLWLHVVSDLLIGTAYVGISIILYILVRKIRLPFSPVFVAFGLFIGLCGLTHFFQVWTVWNPDYWSDGVIKAATATASVATAVGLFFIKPQIEEFVHAARLSEERRIRLESTNAELEVLYRKVKEMDELKTQFFANVSHELRTPLALILGPSEQMLDDDNLRPEQRRQLQSIVNNGKTLLKQVNDLLDVSKLEAGQMDARYARLDLASWLRRIASQFELMAEQRGIRYRVAVPDTMAVEADPDMLERVFINLLSNAFKFTPDGGSIDVELRPGGQDFEFVVSDSGPGVAADQRELIFERFRQGEDHATRTHGGTGLGLAIVKDFVQLHGGKVTVDQAPQGGARFVVQLPGAAPAGAAVHDVPQGLAPATRVALEGVLQELRTESEARSAHPDEQVHLSGRPNVLVVEDNRDMRDFIAGILAADYNVVSASDGEQGLERALEMQPDLIVTDVMMPRMSGDQLVAALRARPELALVPVLLLTAKSDDALRVKLLREGAQDYLTKPFLEQELRARAGNLIAVKRAGDALRREMSTLSGDLEELATQLSAKHRQLQLALDSADVAREQAERANQVKGQFLGMLSHELRTPLATIDMNIELLSRQPSGGASNLHNPRVDRMAKAARQMTTLIDGLLEYTRLESGRIEARAEQLDAVEIAREVIDAHADAASAGVRLALDPPREVGVLVSDGRLLRVVLSNLVSNALKFTQQGTITLRVYEGAGQHGFEVHDTGIGIPEADLARIFQPFEQLEAIPRKSIPGVGLGLALVKRIVEALQGQVEVVSEVDVGSTFRIVLPSVPSASSGASASASSGMSASSDEERA